MPNLPKTVRISEEQLEVINQLLLGQYPDITTEADMIRAAFTQGLYVLAAQALIPGEGMYGGLSPEVVAAHIERNMIALLPFVLANGTLLRAALVQLQQLGTLHINEPPSTSTQDAPVSLFDENAHHDVDGLGADFI